MKRLLTALAVMALVITAAPKHSTVHTQQIAAKAQIKAKPVLTTVTVLPVPTTLAPAFHIERRAIPVTTSTTVDDDPITFRSVDGECITTGAGTAAQIGVVNDSSCVGDSTPARTFWARDSHGLCFGTGQGEAASLNLVYDSSCEDAR